MPGENSQISSVCNGFTDLSCKISSERSFKSLGLRGVVMAVVSRESLHLSNEKVFNRTGKGLVFVMNYNFGR